MSSASTRDARAADSRLWARRVKRSAYCSKMARAAASSPDRSSARRSAASAMLASLWRDRICEKERKSAAACPVRRPFLHPQIAAAGSRRIQESEYGPCRHEALDWKRTRLNSSYLGISYVVFCFIKTIIYMSLLL